jgi:hypothetical protein
MATSRRSSSINSGSRTAKNFHLEFHEERGWSIRCIARRLKQEMTAKSKSRPVNGSIFLAVTLLSDSVTDKIGHRGDVKEGRDAKTILQENVIQNSHIHTVISGFDVILSKKEEKDLTTFASNRQLESGTIGLKGNILHVKGDAEKGGNIHNIR